MNAIHAPNDPTSDAPITALERLLARFDPSVFDVGRRRVRSVSDRANRGRDRATRPGQRRTAPTTS